MVAIHFYVRGRGEAEILNRDEAIGNNLHGAPPFFSVLVRDLARFASQVTSLLPDGLFCTADSFLNFSSFLLRVP
jgi:hypothetical protein